MKLINKIVYILVISLFFLSCSKDKPQANEESVISEKILAENLKNIVVDIKGMTCEIGCARLIQSKLYKTDGIKYAKVSFEDSIGNITFDANKISQVEIKNIIQKIAGGDLYKVDKINEVDNFSKKLE